VKGIPADRTDWGTATPVPAYRPAPGAVAKGETSVPPAVVSVRVLVPTPNPTRGSQGNWRAGAALAKRQREAVALVLFGMTPPAAPWTVTLTRVSAGRLDDDNLRAALKHVRDACAAFLLGGTPGEMDDDSRLTWVYAQRPGKRSFPAVDVEIVTRTA
jgi:hypothetical protein